MMEEIIKYLQQLENPMKVGFDEHKQIWTPPTGKGFDKNQIGYGLDMRKGPVAEFLRLRKQREGRVYLTVDEEKKFREDYIRKDLNKIYTNNTTGFAPKSDGFHIMTPKRKAIAFGLLYRGDGKKLWNSGNPIYDTFWHGTDDEFEQAVINFYTPFLPERVRNHKAFWGNGSPHSRKPVEYSPKMKVSTRFEVEPPEMFSRGGLLKRKPTCRRLIHKNRYLIY